MNIGRKKLRYIFLGTAGCILLYWMLFDTERVKGVWKFLMSMISPFAVGAGIAFVLNVPMSAIEKRLSRIGKQGLRRGIALLLTFIAIFLVLFLVVRLLWPQIVLTVDKLAAQLPGFGDRIYTAIHDFLASHPEWLEWVENNTNFEQLNGSALMDKLVDIVGNGSTNIVSGAFSVIGSLSSGIFDGVIAFVFSLYCLCRKEILARQAKQLLYAFLPERFCDKSVRILRLTTTTFANFISGQCLDACILGCMFAICMLIFRMPYVPLISVLVAVAALVPIVGAFVGCILGGFFILVDGDPMKALWFVVMFLIIQQFDGNVIYPKVVGKSVGLPGMWVLVAVMIGGSLMGIAGMFIMIPVFSVLYTLLREITNKRLKARGIPQEKLCEQPPELRPGINWKNIFKLRKKAQTADQEGTADTSSENNP